KESEKKQKESAALPGESSSKRPPPRTMRLKLRTGKPCRVPRPPRVPVNSRLRLLFPGKKPPGEVQGRSGSGRKEWETRSHRPALPAGRPTGQAIVCARNDTTRKKTRHAGQSRRLHR